MASSKTLHTCFWAFCCWQGHCQVCLEAITWQGTNFNTNIYRSTCSIFIHRQCIHRHLNHNIISSCRRDSQWLIPITPIVWQIILWVSIWIVLYFDSLVYTQLWKSSTLELCVLQDWTFSSWGNYFCRLKLLLLNFISAALHIRTQASMQAWIPACLWYLRIRSRTFLYFLCTLPLIDCSKHNSLTVGISNGLLWQAVDVSIPYGIYTSSNPTQTPP